MWDVMAEPETLTTREIDALLAEPECLGGTRIVVRQPDGTFRKSSTLWAVGMHSNACRLWYRQKFGQSMPLWTEKLHPVHVVGLVKHCLATNRKLPTMFAGP